MPDLPLKKKKCDLRRLSLVSSWTVKQNEDYIHALMVFRSNNQFYNNALVLLSSYILAARNPLEIMNIAAISRKVLKIYLSVEMAHLLLTLLLQKPVKDGLVCW